MQQQTFLLQRLKITSLIYIEPEIYNNDRYINRH